MVGLPGMASRRSSEPDAVPRAQMRAYAKVRAAADKVKSLDRMANAATDELHATIVHAADTGIPHIAIAEIVGLSEGRIWQIVHDWQRPIRGKKGTEQ